MGYSIKCIRKQEASSRLCIFKCDIDGFIVRTRMASHPWPRIWTRPRNSVNSYTYVYATTSALFLTLTKLPFVVCIVAGHAKEKQNFSTLPILEAGPKFVPVAPPFSSVSSSVCVLDFLSTMATLNCIREYTKLMSIQFFDSLNIFLDQLVSFYTPAWPSNQPQ